MNPDHESESLPVGTEEDYPPVHPLLRLLLLLSIGTLPFCVAGTLNIGFPLKAYEVIWSLIAFCYFVGRGVGLASPLVLLQEEHRAVNLALLYIGVGTVSCVFGYFIVFSYGARIQIDSWRHDPMVSSALKCGYLVLNVFVLRYLLGAKSISTEEIGNAWIVGAVLAALYGWYLFASGIIGRMPLLLPGQDVLHLQQGGPLIPTAIRCGTFLEGNHAGLFYVLSAAISYALFVRTWKFWYFLFGTFFLFSLLHTLSTGGFLAGFVFVGALALMMTFHSRRMLGVGILSLFVFGLLGSLLYQTDAVQEIVVKKLMSDDVEDPGGSIAQREDLVRSGFEMFQDYPVLGVGLSNFGYLYPFYTHYGATEIGFDPAGAKNIPNNVYSEISTETGVIGSLVFLIFCFYITTLYRKGNRNLESKIYLAGFFGLYMGWMAYPTLSILFQWVFFALAIRTFLAPAEESPKVITDD